MRRHTVEVAVLGPWSLTTSRAFWEGFSPAALPRQARAGDTIRTVFPVEADWSRAEAAVTHHDVTQHGSLATIRVAGGGDLAAAADQVRRFLSLDVDARGWPDIARRDPVIADAQTRLPGLRPCGFHSPYEAAAWSVLSVATVGPGDRQAGVSGLLETSVAPVQRWCRARVPEYVRVEVGDDALPPHRGRRAGGEVDED